MLGCAQCAGAARAQIGYWRYISIYRHLQRNPDSQLYPLFEYFENWCQDENRHGDFFTAILKSQPQARPGAAGGPTRGASPAARGVPCMRARRPQPRRLPRPQPLRLPLSAQALPERLSAAAAGSSRAGTAAPCAGRAGRRDALRAPARPGRRPA